MAHIFTKSTTEGNVKGLILDYREGLRYPFKIQDWNRMKFAIAWSYTGTGDNNNMDGYGAQNITANTPQDRYYFGVKKYSPNFPMENDREYFLGVSSAGAFSYIDFPVAFFNPTNNHGEYVDIGVRHPDGSYDGFQHYYGTNPLFAGPGSPDFDNTSGYGIIMAFDIEFVNKGQANQQMNVKYAKTTFTNASQVNMDSYINSATYTDLGPLDFNYNSVPYEAPDSFFMYLPFGAARLRVFGLRAIRIS